MLFPVVGKVEPVPRRRLCQSGARPAAEATLSRKAGSRIPRMEQRIETMPVQEKLARSVIFAGILPEDIEDLLARGRDASFEAGHRLFDRGEPARELMLLRDGVVELVLPIRVLGATRDLIMETKQAGDVVAWSALVAPHRFTLAARCASDCCLIHLGREVLESYFAERPEVGFRFMRNLAGVIGQRLYTMQTIWMRDLQSSAAKRLG